MVVVVVVDVVVVVVRVVVVVVVVVVVEVVVLCYMPRMRETKYASEIKSEQGSRSLPKLQIQHASRAAATAA